MDYKQVGQNVTLSDVRWARTSFRRLRFLLSIERMSLMLFFIFFCLGLIFFAIDAFGLLVDNSFFVDIFVFSALVLVVTAVLNIAITFIVANGNYFPIFIAHMHIEDETLYVKTKKGKIKDSYPISSIKNIETFFFSFMLVRYAKIKICNISFNDGREPVSLFLRDAPLGSSLKNSYTLYEVMDLLKKENIEVERGYIEGHKGNNQFFPKTIFHSPRIMWIGAVIILVGVYLRYFM
ncbi:TMEM106 family protein [Patescibacteria group bacterium]|nr:TMEM106 family protein [Patescibacteria group bacterium]